MRRCSIYRVKSVSDVPVYDHILNCASLFTDIPTTLQRRNLYLTLVTLLFAHVYDRRTTQNDPTPESAWTICSLVPAFSALDPPPYMTTEGVPFPVPTPELTDDDLASVLVASYRRSLAFPLYRSFVLADACRKDVAAVLAKGRRMTTRYLLEMKHILDHHEVYYVYSKIWLDDFCVWIQASARCGIFSMTQFLGINILLLQRRDTI